MLQTLSRISTWAMKQVASSRQHNPYTGIPGQDLTDNADEFTQTEHPRRGVRLCGVAAFIGTSGVVVLAIIFFLGGQISSVHDESYSCGSNPADAENHGCVFDTMLYGWTHHKCFDSELMNRYLQDGNWTWRDDPQHEAPFSDAMVVGVESKELAKRGLWTSRPDDSGRWIHRWEFHLVHCAYAWELIERAYHREDVWIYKELSGEDGVEHAEHCGERWAAAARHELDADSREFIETKIGGGPPVYYTCVSLKTRRGN